MTIFHIDGGEIDEGTDSDPAGEIGIRRSA